MLPPRGPFLIDAALRLAKVVFQSRASILVSTKAPQHLDLDVLHGSEVGGQVQFGTEGQGVGHQVEHRGVTCGTPLGDRLAGHRDHLVFDHSVFGRDTTSRARVGQRCLVVTDLGEHHRTMGEGRADRQHFGGAGGVEGGGRRVEPVVEQAVAFQRVGFALGGVVVGGGHAGVGELSGVVCGREAQGTIEQVESGLDEP